MACKLVWRILVFACISAVCALPSTVGIPPPTEGDASKEVGPPAYHSQAIVYNLPFSSHVLVLAGNQHSTRARGVQLCNIMYNLIHSLAPVMDELKGRTPISTSDPSPAYRTFFKDTHNLSYIRKLLMRVAWGEQVYSPTFPPHAWQKISPQGNPVILVISERRQLGGGTNDTMQDMYDWCAEYSMSTGVIIKNPATPNPLVVLCPYFFEAKPPYVKGDSAIAPVNGKPTKDCLSVNTRTNEFLKVTAPDQHAGYELASYRQWILLHLLASLYRYSDSKDMSDEVMDVNSAWRMNAGEALNNGHNYMWYAASVYGKCTQFPHYTHGDELLETSNADNTSNVGPVNNARLAETVNFTDIEIPVGTPLKIALD